VSSDDVESLVEPARLSVLMIIRFSNRQLSGELPAESRNNFEGSGATVTAASLLQVPAAPEDVVLKSIFSFSILI